MAPVNDSGRDSARIRANIDKLSQRMVNSDEVTTDHALLSFVPRSLLEDILACHGEPGRAPQKLMLVAIIDLSGFSSLSNRLGSEVDAVAELLNRVSFNTVFFLKDALFLYI